MMINLQKFIPEILPCIVDVNDIEYIYTDNVIRHEHLEPKLFLKLKSKIDPIILCDLGYNNKLTIEIMDKVTFAINAAKKGNSIDKE